MPYTAEEIYSMLSLDAKARLAATRYVRRNGRAPTGGQVAQAVADIDASDALDPGAASRAATDAARKLAISGLAAFKPAP